MRRTNLGRAIRSHGRKTIDYLENVAVPGTRFFPNFDETAPCALCRRALAYRLPYFCLEIVPFYLVTDRVGPATNNASFVLSTA